MNDERDLIVIGRSGNVVFIENHRTGARIELTNRMARAVRLALRHWIRATSPAPTIQCNNRTISKDPGKPHAA
jgi:hypothetical protein